MSLLRTSLNESSLNEQQNFAKKKKKNLLFKFSFARMKLFLINHYIVPHEISDSETHTEYAHLLYHSRCLILRSSPFTKFIDTYLCLPTFFHETDRSIDHSYSFLHSFLHSTESAESAKSAKPAKFATYSVERFESQNRFFRYGISLLLLKKKKKKRI